MDKTELPLLNFASLSKKQNAEALLALNEKTAEYGLSLTEAQAASLAETPMNLFEPVFCHAALLAALGKDPTELDGLNAPENVWLYAELCKLNLLAAVRTQVKKHFENE